MSRCIPNMTGDAATAFSALQAENLDLQAQKVRWFQIHQTQENQIDNLEAENERLRAELEQARTDCAVAEKNHADCIDELEQVKREFDGICEYIDSEGFLRKQFCENGNPDFEPCICPSLQEHPGYIDSDDCEGCDHFCNSWRGQKED